MSNLVTIGNREVFVAFFGLGEFGFDFFGKRGEIVSVFGADVDLLNLEGSALGAEEIGVDENSIIKINVVVIDGVLFVVEKAGNEELHAEGGEGAADGFLGAKELEGKVAANGGSVGLAVVGDKSAGFKTEILNGFKIFGGANERSRIDCMGVRFIIVVKAVGGESGDGGGERSNGSNTFDALDSFDII